MPCTLWSLIVEDLFGAGRADGAEEPVVEEVGVVAVRDGCAHLHRQDESALPQKEQQVLSAVLGEELDAACCLELLQDGRLH